MKGDLFHHLMIVLVLLSVSIVYAENGTILVQDSFDTLSPDWQPIILDSSSGGSGGAYAGGGKLNVYVNDSNTISGAYHTTSFSGHFYAEVEFTDDDHCGLALIQKKTNGQPDKNNFTSIKVETNSGKIYVKLRDKQNGTDDVRDNTGQIGASATTFNGVKRYEHELNNHFSLPYTNTNKKFRIFRDDASGFFHLYYAVTNYIHGQWCEGWIELAPSRDWGSVGKEFFLCLYVSSDSDSSATAEFDNVKVIQKPLIDQSDVGTGFKAVQREYNWSGQYGDAVVVSFGNDFAYRSDDRKFVFWSGANYFPAWHMNNQLLFSYECVETWGGGVDGCHEPMSDRNLRWSNVEILEDNNVRKVVHWNYVLVNPDYMVPDDSNGSQVPEADEWWTFYPDGTAIRRIRYTPKLDTSFRQWHELTELIAIAGTTSNAEDHHSYPALTVFDLGSNSDDYHPDKWSTGSWDSSTENWDQIITSVHFHSAPDAFSAWSQQSSIPDTYAYYQFGPDISWHGAGYKFAHWPAGREPYVDDAAKTHGNWTAQASSNGLMSMGIWNGTDWNSHYETDSRGRKYREWVSLVGLSDAGDQADIKARTKTWLFPGSVVMTDSNSSFDKINYNERLLEFSYNNTGTKECNFTLSPGATTVINPAFKVTGWGGSLADVVVGGVALSNGIDCQVDVHSGDLLVWVKGQYSSSTTFELQGYDLGAQGSIKGLWKLDEGSGAIAYDSADDDCQATANNNPAWQTSSGKFGGALQFNGSDQYLQTEDSSGTLQLSGDYTLSVWLNANASQSSWAGIMIKASPGGLDNHWGMQFDGEGDDIVVYHPAGMWDSGVNLSDVAGGWHHLCIVRQGTTMRSYVDSALVLSETWTDPPGVGTGHLNIGTERSVWGFYEGMLDEIAVFDVALDQAQIDRLNIQSAQSFIETCGRVGVESQFVLVGDVNRDCLVNIYDYAVVAANWLETGSMLYGDIELDNAVDIDDVRKLSDDWLGGFDTNLTAHLTLDEGSGAVADDSSVYGNNAIVNGDRSWNPGGGQVGGALSFDGVDAYIEINGYTGVTGTKSRTVAAWIKTSGSGTIIAWGNENSNGSKWFLKIHSTGQLRLGVGGGNIISSTYVNDGTWRHIAAVIADDGSPNVDEVKFYIDGQEETVYNSVSSQEINTVEAIDVMIGAVNYSGTLITPFSGQIDDVRVYDRALSETEIETLSLM